MTEWPSTSSQTNSLLYQNQEQRRLWYGGSARCSRWVRLLDVGEICSDLKAVLLTVSLLNAVSAIFPDDNNRAA
jgi:hypothetical protein